MRHGEVTECTGAFGVHAPLGDHLARKVGQFFQMPDILQQHGPAWASRHGVLVVGHWGGSSGREFGHGRSLSNRVFSAQPLGRPEEFLRIVDCYPK